MSVNGVTGAASAYETYQTSQTDVKTAEKAAEKTTTDAASKQEEAGAVYEPSKGTATDSTKKTYTQNTALVAKMKADQENRQKQLQSIVEQLMTKQGQTYNSANGIWSILAGGNLEVDEATKLQAQKDVAEDGYWGVKQTSERILDFATALTGGDPDKIEEMREAFKKGYEQAEKTWGGELPEISRQTYDAVMSGFDKMAEDAGIVTASN
ncbi:MAG: hypothetical protein NC341_07790 [Blautia sp.]|nr:hypothetical protein [Blautia sp.]MCM1201456.1 hypothetical protein [Bacteroides fragilis]